jgi:hypothetical protein
MTDQNEKIWQEPKIALQIISKVLQGINGNGKGVTVNVITIGKLVVTINGKEMTAEEVNVVEGEEAQVLLGSDPPHPLLEAKDDKVKFPYNLFPVIDQALEKENSQWTERSTLQARAILRRFFLFLATTRGEFELNDIGQEDVLSFLKERLKTTKAHSVRAEKWYILHFFKLLEKQGIRIAIPSFTFNQQELREKLETEKSEERG